MAEMASSEAVATYLNIVLYAVSYHLERPVEPFLRTDEESAANRTYGRLTSFFSLIQTVGSPLVGTLLDRIGPKRTSILVYAGSALSYWILAHATTPAWLYLSKVPTLLQHAFLVGQATVASIPDEGEGSSARRAAALGRMTTAYTIGATIGPALGGYLASTDLYAGARLAVWGSLISVLLSVVFLKGHTERGKDDSEEKTQPLRTQRSFLQSVRKTLSFLRHPTIGPLLFIKTFNGVSSSAFGTILPLILANKLHFSPAQLGYFMSASSISVALFAAVGISPAMRSVGNRSDRLAFVAIGCRLVAIVCFGLVASWAMSTLTVESEEDIIIAIPVKGIVSTTLASVAVSLSSHMHATSLTTLTTGSISAEERGAILGLEHGLFAAARIVGPPLGTALLSRGPTYGFLSELGADGLLRVIVACAVMDLLLMALLSVWSRNYGTTFDPNTDREVKPLVEDHDHSD